MKVFHLIIVMTTLLSVISAQENQQMKMADFIGINSNVAAYDQKYLTDLVKCAKWMRE